ncbi:unnamed protein product, partial [Clonostachys chloroleuca]
FLALLYYSILVLVLGFYLFRKYFNILLFLIILIGNSYTISIRSREFAGSRLSLNYYGSHYRFYLFWLSLFKLYNLDFSIIIALYSLRLNNQEYKTDL